MCQVFKHCFILQKKVTDLFQALILSGRFLFPEDIALHNDNQNSKVNMNRPVNKQSINCTYPLLF